MHPGSRYRRKHPGGRWLPGQRSIPDPGQVLRLEDLGQHPGHDGHHALHAEGKATWTCDSTSQWLWRGVDQEFEYLIKRWKDEGIYDDILKGNIHIIWTGGEPTIKGHQQAIVNFTNQWLSKHIDNTISPFYEIETKSLLNSYILP